MKILRIVYSIAYLMKCLSRKCRCLCIKGVSVLTKNKKVCPRYNEEEAMRYLHSFRPHIPVDFSNIYRNKRKVMDISIIIPVYNAEKYLDECLGSIFGQKTKYSYEVICVDDGSKDSSLNILRKYEEKYENIIVITQQNKGSSVARNVGLEKMTGKYVLFVDADDFLQENSLDVLMEAALKTGASIVQGKVLKCNERSDVFYKYKIKVGITTSYIEYCQSLGTPWGKLYLSSLWEDVKFFEGYAYEDTIIFLVIYLKCNKMLFVNQEIYTFRTTTNSQFKRQNNSNKKLDSLWIVDECIRLNNELKLQYNQEYYQVLIWHLSVGLISRVQDTDDEKLLEAVFVVARKLVTEFGKNSNTFLGKNEKIYIKIEKSFHGNNFYEWKLQSKILELVGGL